TQGYNPGRTEASEAAKAVGGKALFPIFAPGEQSSDPKKFSDFNDLATRVYWAQKALSARFVWLSMP
ncbi:MAG: hypothetical protein WBL28_03680, partial [Methylotenera sp.]